MDKLRWVSQLIHGPIAIALIAWLWISWSGTVQAPNLSTGDLSLGWYYFFLSVGYSIVILLSRFEGSSLLQHHQLAFGGHAFFMLAWYAIRLKPAVRPNDDNSAILLNKYYLFAFIVTLTLCLLAPFVAYGKVSQASSSSPQDSAAT